jgi:hypothetical protein
LEQPHQSRLLDLPASEVLLAGEVRVLFAPHVDLLAVRTSDFTASDKF